MQRYRSLQFAAHTGFGLDVRRDGVLLDLVDAAPSVSETMATQRG